VDRLPHRAPRRPRAALTARPDAPTGSAHRAAAAARRPSLQSGAVGRSILVIIWHLLADPAARFNDLGPGWHDEQAGRDRRIRSHLRQLKALGLDVTINPAAA
jgi:hypothetical protein